MSLRSEATPGAAFGVGCGGRGKREMRDVSQNGMSGESTWCLHGAERCTRGVG